MRACNDVHPAWQLSPEQAIFCDNKIFTYVCEDEAAFGFVTSGEPLESFFCDGATGEIRGLYVLPGYQGNGYGRKLLVHGLTVLKRLGFDRAILWIPDFADRAIRVAIKSGFTRLDVSRTTNQVSSTLAVLDESCYSLDLTDYF